MGKRLTACLLALCLAASLLCSVSAKEPEISVEIDQTGQDSTVAVITLGSEAYTSILVKVPGEPWYDFTWVLEDAKSMTLPVYENGSVQVQATRENGTKATASATVDCLPEPEPLDCPVEAEPEKEPEPQPTPQKQPTATPPVTTVPRPEETQDKPKDEATPETGTESKTETPEPGSGFTGEGNAVTRDLLYDKATNKQFVTLETKDGTVFYLVIDYDSPVNEEEEQYQTYFLNLVDAADLAALVGEEEAEPEEEAPPLCSCRERCQVGKINTTCPVCTADLTACLGEEPEPEAPEELEDPQPAPDAEEPEEDSSSAVAAVILLLVILVGGAVFVVKLLRRKEKTPSRPPEDDDEDYVVENVEEEEP